MEINNLTLNEEKLRNLYLRKIALGEIYGPITGYPDRDRLWLSKYSEEAIVSDVPKKTLYQFVYDNNCKHMNDNAIRFFGKNITYKELFENIDKCAKSLLANGIKKGDVVGICCPTTPEAIYLFYAINRIGAISNLIDIRKNSEDIKHCLEVGNTKMLFVYDGEAERIGNVAKENGIEKIVSVSPTLSLGNIFSFVSNPNQYIKNHIIKKNNRAFEMYNDFIKKGEIIENIPEVNYEENELAFIQYTSGSTGKPKAVELCNDTANARVHQYMNNGMVYKRGEVYLDIIPIFIAFGSIVGIHLPISMGLVDDLIPAYDGKKIFKIMKKNKPNHMTLTPASYIELISTKRKGNIDYSKVHTWGCGGDGMNASEEVIINQSLILNNSMEKVSNGYGASEIGAPFSTQKNGANIPGSVGVPLPGNSVIIFKHNTLEPLPYGEIGDVCMIVDYPMIKYRQMEELTKQTRIKLPDGRIGICLKDGGYVDENGNLFIKGRYEDAIEKNEKTIWPVDIENCIMKTNMIKICAVAKDLTNINDVNIFAVPNNNFDEAEFNKQLFELLHITGMDNITCEINYIEDMPLTPSGKIDRKKLKAKANEIILKK